MKVWTKVILVILSGSYDESQTYRLRSIESYMVGLE